MVVFFEWRCRWRYWSERNMLDKYSLDGVLLFPVLKKETSTYITQNQVGLYSFGYGRTSHQWCWQNKGGNGMDWCQGSLPLTTSWSPGPSRKERSKLRHKPPTNIPCAMHSVFPTWKPSSWHHELEYSIRMFLPTPNNSNNGPVGFFLMHLTSTIFFFVRVCACERERERERSYICWLRGQLKGFYMEVGQKQGAVCSS